MRKRTLKRITLGLLPFLSALSLPPIKVAAQTTPTRSTNPNSADSDGDGFFDGPDTWIELPDGSRILRIGEDKNGNGKYEPAGEDGILNTGDDETNPNNPTSYPSVERIAMIDSDADGLSNALEEIVGSDPADADTDDDGVSDGDEALKFGTRPGRADSDNDGLPDGFELGLTYSTLDSEDPDHGLNAYNAAWFGEIDRDATYFLMLRDDPEQLLYQVAFRVPPSAVYRSDPLSFDSDFDGVSDLDEYNSGTDPMRGLARGADLEADPEEPLLYINGLAPVTRQNRAIYLDYRRDDDAEFYEEGTIYFEATLALSLGVSGAPITLEAVPLDPNDPVPAVFVGSASSATFTSSETSAFKDQYQIATTTIRWTETLSPFRIKMTLGPGDEIDYGVGLNRYYFDYPTEYFGDGGPPVGLARVIGPGFLGPPMLLGAPGRTPSLMASGPGGGMPLVAGVGFIREEGELLSQQVWTNDDWINVGIEAATSGGTASFELLYLGAKYALSIFMNMVVAPLEFYLQFILSWRDNFATRVPEDFRFLTGMILDSRIDMGFLARYTQFVSEREGWDHLFPDPFAYAYESVPLENIEGGFAPLGIDNLPAPAEPGAAETLAARGQDPPARSASNNPTPPPFTSVTAIMGSKSQLHETALNEMAHNGNLSHLGIPKGTKWVDFGYGAGHGPDGCFIGRNGDIYLLEAKNYKDGGGILGKIRGLNPLRPKNLPAYKVTQGTPQWLMKAMGHVQRDAPSRWAKISREMDGNSFSKIMRMVEAVDANALSYVNSLVGKNLIEDFEIPRMLKAIRDFSDPELITKTLGPTHAQLASEAGNLLGSKFHLAVGITKDSGVVRHLDKVPVEASRFITGIGGKVTALASRIVKGAPKTPF